MIQVLVQFVWLFIAFGVLGFVFGVVFSDQVKTFLAKHNSTIVKDFQNQISILCSQHKEELAALAIEVNKAKDAIATQAFEYAKQLAAAETAKAELANKNSTLSKLLADHAVADVMAKETVETPHQ